MEIRKVPISLLNAAPYNTPFFYFFTRNADRR